MENGSIKCIFTIEIYIQNSTVLVNLNLVFFGVNKGRNHSRADGASFTEDSDLLEEIHINVLDF